YTVRLKESLRKEAPRDTARADSLIRHDQEQNDDAAPVTVAPPEKKPTFLQKIFGKKDTSAKKPQPVLDPKAKLKADIKRLRDEEDQQELLIDTAGKTRKEIRQEKRRLRSQEKDQEKALKQAAEGQN